MMARQLKANAGAKLRAQILSYDHAKTFYEAYGGARKGNRAPLAHNTVIAERATDVRGAPAYAIQLHRTDIVTFMPDGGIVLDNGGYQTVTTKARMNEILHPLGVGISQSKFEWHVYEIGSDAKPIPYFNGMEIRVERPAVWTGEKWESHVTLPGETRHNPGGQIMLSGQEDLDWLREGHLASCRRLPDFEVAVLAGNEDWPTSITLYETDHVNSLTMTLVPDADGVFHCRSDKY